jgi:hypothetical protein
MAPIFGMIGQGTLTPGYVSGHGPEYRSIGEQLVTVL